MILDPICESTRREVLRLRARIPVEALRARAKSAPPARDFARAISGPPLNLIAEIKKASPSAGLLRTRLTPARIARAYRDAGASAVSVVTERSHFRGDPAWIPAVRKASGLPVLMKDFFLDPWQIVRARALGADAILLIVRILAPRDLKAMLALSRDLGMEPLVECHEASEVREARRAGARIVGVNCRDLDTLDVDLSRSLRMARLLDNLEPVPGWLLTICQSAGPATPGSFLCLRFDIVKLLWNNDLTIMKADRTRRSWWYGTCKGRGIHTQEIGASPTNRRLPRRPRCARPPPPRASRRRAARRPV